MAHHKSAKRQWRHSLRRKAINRRNKSLLRTQIKKLQDAIKNKNKEEAQRLLPLTFSIIDKTVKKGSIHENKGNRFKSKLTRQLELLNTSPSK
ncbi:MAG: 30S ribosomal protein S20 [Candidatus Aminicenantes bacterium]|nr:30S ribosomal protein S20 [Candidatus Aminicenantes bacterium]